MGFKFKFLSIFGDILLPHRRSLEFRSRVLAAMLCAKKSVSDDDYNAIQDIAIKIYGKDVRRIGVLLKLTRDYVDRVKTSKLRTLDELLREIDDELALVNRYAKKVDFEDLRTLMIDSDEEDVLVQQRVYEYMLSEVRRYGN